MSSTRKITNIPVVSSCLLLPSQIPLRLVLEPGLHLPVPFVEDWKASQPSTDLVERLVLLMLAPHPHSINNDITTYKIYNNIYTQEKFENGVFTVKMYQVISVQPRSQGLFPGNKVGFPLTLRQRNLKMQQSAVILDLYTPL